MDDPVNEISGVIHSLTQTPPSKQRETIETYFTPNASFTHPFCRTGSFDGSRLLVLVIYRWYKIMSPRIDIKINSIAYDAQSLRLYVHISQVFRIWAIPFYSAPVSLVTVLQLIRDKQTGKCYIQSQEDLYQVNEFVRFFWPGGFILVWLWQVIATAFCLLGAFVLRPVTIIEERVANKRKELL